MEIQEAIKIIEKQQKELEPIKKLNIPVETLVSEFNRLEDLEDNTEILKSELEKKDKELKDIYAILEKSPELKASIEAAMSINEKLVKQEAKDSLKIQKLNKIIDKMAELIYKKIDMLEMGDMAKEINYSLEELYSGIEDEEAIKIIKNSFTNLVEKENK